MIDLSFTKDPEWMAARETSWLIVEEELKRGLRKKGLSLLKSYYMTGALPEEVDYSAITIFGYFPLQTPEGWDYIFEALITASNGFECVFLDNFRGLSDAVYFSGSEIELWDYFLGPVFEPTITSRVPVGKAGEKVTLQLDPLDMFCRIIPGIFGFLERGGSGDHPKWIQRVDYFWSLWPYITDVCFSDSDKERNSEASRTGRLVQYLLEHVVKYKPTVKFDDPNKTRPQFLKGSVK